MSVHLRNAIDDRLFVMAVRGVFAMSFRDALDAADVVCEETERAWRYLPFETRQSIRAAVEGNRPSLDRIERMVEVCDSYLMDDEIEEGVFWWRS